MTKEITGETSHGEGQAPHEELGRILHSLSQPLTAISNYAQAGCQLIDAGLDDPARLRELFEKIAAQSQRTIGISQEMKRTLGPDVSS